MTPEHEAKDCTAHSGIVHDLQESQKQRQRLFELIELLQTTKASSSQMRWVIGVFLIISMAVVGFLWHAQVSLGNKIIQRLDSDAVLRQTMSDNINIVKNQNELQAYKLEQHLKAWPGLPNGVQDDSKRKTR